MLISPDERNRIEHFIKEISPINLHFNVEKDSWGNTTFCPTWCGWVPPCIEVLPVPMPALTLYLSWFAFLAMHIIQNAQIEILRTGTTQESAVPQTCGTLHSVLWTKITSYHFCKT